jgi:hypothetical protein
MFTEALCLTLPRQLNTTEEQLLHPIQFSDLFSAGAGSITVSVVDLNGCSAQATINVVQPALLDPGRISADQIICFGGNPATLDESIPPTGGPGAYIYQWQSAANAAGPFFNIAAATSGTYTPPAGASYTIYYRRMVTPVYVRTGLQVRCRGTCQSSLR